MGNSSLKESQGWSVEEKGAGGERVRESCCASN